MAGIKLKNIHKTYQVDGRAFPVLNGIDLEIPAGKITVILGQSGCGKTTLLRLTGGLESADERRGPLGRRPQDRLCVPGTAAHAMAKRLGQHYFRAEERIRSIGPKFSDIIHDGEPVRLREGIPVPALRRHAAARGDRAGRWPYEPTFILMDEPFAALDYFTREQMQKELLRVQQQGTFQHHVRNPQHR